MGEKLEAWEYCCVRIDGQYAEGEARTHLCALGRDGWELVSVCVQFTSHFAYFKRRRSIIAETKP